LSLIWDTHYDRPKDDRNEKSFLKVFRLFGRSVYNEVPDSLFSGHSQCSADSNRAISGRSYRCVRRGVPTSAVSSRFRVVG
jgi:hypothetical protein